MLEDLREFRAKLHKNPSETLDETLEADSIEEFRNQYLLISSEPKWIFAALCIKFVYRNEEYVY